MVALLLQLVPFLLVCHCVVLMLVRDLLLLLLLLFLMHLFHVDWSVVLALVCPVVVYPFLLQVLALLLANIAQSCLFAFGKSFQCTDCYNFGNQIANNSSTSNNSKKSNNRNNSNNSKNSKKSNNSKNSNNRNNRNNRNHRNTRNNTKNVNNGYISNNSNNICRKEI